MEKCEKFRSEKDNFSPKSNVTTAKLPSVSEDEPLDADETFETSLEHHPKTDEWGNVRRKSFATKPLLRKISTVLKTPTNATVDLSKENTSSPLATEIRELLALKNDGILSEKEFLVAKSKVLGVAPTYQDMSVNRENELADLEVEREKIEAERVRLARREGTLRKVKAARNTGSDYV